MDIKEKNNIMYAIIIYLGILFFIASFIMIGISLIICFKDNLNFVELYTSFAATDFSEFPPQIIKANAITQAYSNLIAYLISTVLVVVFLRKYLVEDFNKIKDSKFKFILYSIGAGILFIVISYGIDFALSYFVDSSQNQQNIEMIMSNGGKIPMVISVVLLAPVVEELIYRKAIFKLTENGNIKKSYIISIVAFTLPHMISTSGNILTWLLQCIPYAACGFMLCYIYEKSNKNTYAVIIAHMMNNLLAAILMFM